MHLTSCGCPFCCLLTHASLMMSGFPLTQASTSQSLVKPSGRLEREVAPDLGLGGAAQLGIKLGSQAKPAAAHTPSQPSFSSRPPSSSHRPHSQPSTSGRSAACCCCWRRCCCCAGWCCDCLQMKKSFFSPLLIASFHVLLHNLRCRARRDPSDILAQGTAEFGVQHKH